MKVENIARFAVLALMLFLVQLVSRNTLVNASPSPSAKVTEWTLPTSGVYPYNLVVSLGKVYFTEERGNKIGCLDRMTNVLKEWTVPTASADLRGIALYQGKIWFTEFAGNKIGRLDPSTGAFAEWRIPTSGSQPWNIFVYEGKVWFTEYAGGKVGRLDPSTNRFTEWGVPNTSPVPLGITVDSSGKVWVTRGQYQQYGRISRLDPSTNTFKEWRIPNISTLSTDIIISGDGKVWFTELYRDRVGRLDSSTGKLTEWSVPKTHATATPDGICEDAMGNLFFTEQTENQIGKLKPKGGTTRTLSTLTRHVVPVGHTISSVRKTVSPASRTILPRISTIPSSTSGSFTEWNIPTARSGPKEIFTEDGTIFYFTEVIGNKIARFEPQYTFTEWSLPKYMHDVIRPGTGNLVWYLFGNNKTGKLDLSGNPITEWTIPTTYSSSLSSMIVAGGEVWFSEDKYWNWGLGKGVSKLVRLNPSTNTITKWTIPMYGDWSNVIAVHDSKVWLAEGACEEGASRICRFDPSTSTFAEWTLETSAAGSFVVYRGQIWFTERDWTETFHRIVRFDPSTNTFTKWALPESASCTLYSGARAVLGSQIWFAVDDWEGTLKVPYIASFDSQTSTLTKWMIPTSDTTGTRLRPLGIALYGTKVWFSDCLGNMIGMLNPTGGTASRLSHVSSIHSPSSVTRSPTTMTAIPTTKSAIIPTRRTDVYGVTTGQFKELQIPTEHSSPYLLTAGSGEVWFSELISPGYPNSYMKIGMLG